jgi:hypothetical protein
MENEKGGGLSPVALHQEAGLFEANRPASVFKLPD